MWNQTEKLLTQHIYAAKSSCLRSMQNLQAGGSGVRGEPVLFDLDAIVASNSHTASPSSGSGCPRASGCSGRPSEPALQGATSDRGAVVNLDIWASDERRRDKKATISGTHESAQASVRILESATEFEELRNTWSAWSNCPEADIDFFSIHLRHAPGVVRPHVMVVYRDGRPDCMLVGWLHQGSVDFRVGSFALFRSHARLLCFVNGGFLGNQSRENSRLLVREIIKLLHNDEAEAAEFSQLKADSHVYDFARRGPNVFCREHFAPVQTHRYLDLPASFDEFLRSLSRKSRQQFTRYASMLVRDFPGKVSFQSVGSECDVEDFAFKTDEISQKTYQRAVGAGFVNNAEMRDILRAAAQKGALRACLLYINERPVAFASGILSKRTLYGTFTGYDPAFKKYRPGFQTLMRLIQESFESRAELSRVDAGSGDLPYKRALFHSSWKESPVWIFAPSAKGLNLHVRKAVSTLLHCIAMWLLARSGRLRKIKKMWRRYVLSNQGFRQHP